MPNKKLFDKIEQVRIPYTLKQQLIREFKQRKDKYKTLAAWQRAKWALEPGQTLE